MNAKQHQNLRGNRMNNPKQTSKNNPRRKASLWDSTGGGLLVSLLLLYFQRLLSAW